MDSESLLKWLIAPGGLLAGLAAWLFRRRIAGSWIGRRLSVEGRLTSCEEERETDRASFARQIAQRDNEISYLTQRITRLLSEGNKVVEEIERVSDRISPHSPGERTVLQKTSPAWRRPSRGSRAKPTQSNPR